MLTNQEERVVYILSAFVMLLLITKNSSKNEEVVVGIVGRSLWMYGPRGSVIEIYVQFIMLD